MDGFQLVRCPNRIKKKKKRLTSLSQRKPSHGYLLVSFVSSALLGFQMIDPYLSELISLLNQMN